MKTHTMLALVWLSLLAPSLFGQTNTPPISEEARKHFVMGTTLAENAKTAADFSKVVSEFKQAADLAPQLPQARYNLAKAREAAGDYSGAMADLKVYQQFKLSDTEARTVQDKIYALEAKQKMKASENAPADVAKSQTRTEDAKFGWLQGEWSFETEFEGLGNYGAGRGTTRTKKVGDAVEIGPIDSYNNRHLGRLRAFVGKSGKTSWDFHFVEDPGGCMSGKHVPVAVTIGRDQRTIRFQVDSYAGGACEVRNPPYIVTLTRR